MDSQVDLSKCTSSKNLSNPVEFYVCFGGFLFISETQLNYFYYVSDLSRTRCQEIFIDRMLRGKQF